MLARPGLNRWSLIAAFTCYLRNIVCIVLIVFFGYGKPDESSISPQMITPTAEVFDGLEQIPLLLRMRRLHKMQQENIELALSHS